MCLEKPGEEPGKKVVTRFSKVLKEPSGKKVQQLGKLWKAM